MSKGFVTELEGVFRTNYIRVGVLFIFFDIFRIFNSISPKIVIISRDNNYLYFNLTLFAKFLFLGV